VPSRWRPSWTTATKTSCRPRGPGCASGFLTEVNVTSPTGILEANVLYDDAYEVKVVEKLEQKIAARSAA
jgi:hypothetical protein